MVVILLALTKKPKKPSKQSRIWLALSKILKKGRQKLKRENKSNHEQKSQ